MSSDELRNGNSQKGARELHPHSSLVRRARLIRRSTTNQYCEQLKKLKEEDGTLIKQILIIRLKHRSLLSEMEKHLAADSDFVPSVDFSYPPMVEDSPLAAIRATIFYPDFTRSIIQTESESYPVVLTDENGLRTYAYCYKYIPKRSRSVTEREFEEKYLGRCSVLVLIAYYPHEALFHHLAVSFVTNTQKTESHLTPLCRELMAFRIADSGDILRKARSTLSHPEPFGVRNVSSLLETLGVENTIFGFLCLLAEKRILITGPNVSEVSRTVQTFVRLLAPLEWPYTLIPVVPDCRTELCYNPTPYICGILRYNLSKVRDLLCPLPGDTEVSPKSLNDQLQDEIVVIDVERGIVLPCLPLQSLQDSTLRQKALLNWAHGMGFPKAMIADLLSSLRSLLPIKNPLTGDAKIEKRIMVWYARMFGHYSAFGNSLLSARNRKRLAIAHPIAEARECLQWFVETGILQSFFFTQTQSHSPLSDRFQRILRKFSPPVGKNGDRRRARSLLWRLLNSSKF